MKEDTNVLAVIEQMQERMKKGYIKYGTTTADADLKLVDWLQHLQEELMDACVYIEAAKKYVIKIEQLRDMYSDFWDRIEEKDHSNVCMICGYGPCKC